MVSITVNTPLMLPPSRPPSNTQAATTTTPSIGSFVSASTTWVLIGSAAYFLAHAHSGIIVSSIHTQDLIEAFLMVNPSSTRRWLNPQSQNLLFRRQPRYR